MSDGSPSNTRARPVNLPSTMPPLDPRHLQDGAAVGREVALQQAETAGAA